MSERLSENGSKVEDIRVDDGRERAVPLELELEPDPAFLLEPRELELRLAALHLDRDTMVEVFGWDPDAHGL